MTKKPLNGLRLLILTFATLSAGDAARAACEPFAATVPLEGRQFTFVDVDNDGKAEPGDKRIGRQALHDNNGRQIGRQFLVETVLKIDDQDFMTAWQDTAIVALSDGAIFVSSDITGQKLDPRHWLGSYTLKDENVEGSAKIIGGTGAYAGASGMLGFVFKDGNGRFDINVSCN